MDTARNFFSHLPPPAECLAILVGCAQLSVFGLSGLANPDEWAKSYGLPITAATSKPKHPGAIEASSEKSEDDAQKTQRALVAGIAARNITNGLVILGLACYVRDRKSLGLVIATNTITTLADTLIVRWFGSESAVFGHVTGIVNSVALGVGLLRWRRDDPWW